jgi:hypothetical protein
VRAEEHVGEELLRLERGVDDVREEEGVASRELEGAAKRDRGGAGPVEVRDEVEVRVAVVEVEGIAGHVEPEQREPEVVGPHRVRGPAAPDQVEHREEEREAPDDHEVPHRDRLSREAGILRMAEDLSEEEGAVRAEDEVQGEAEPPSRHAWSRTRRGRTRG